MSLLKLNKYSSEHYDFHYVTGSMVERDIRENRYYTGKLVYRFAYRTPKIIFDDGMKKINTFNLFKHTAINKVSYCESCNVMLADLSADS